MGFNRLYSKEYWERNVQQWLSSGKSAKSWCQENQLVYTTFLGWRRRLKCHNDLKANNSPEPHLLSRSSSGTHFVELKNQSKIYPGIFLECEGVKIHLTAEFDGSTLRKCLDVLRGAPC